jgi:hypothetical protein
MEAIRGGNLNIQDLLNKTSVGDAIPAAIEVEDDEAAEDRAAKFGPEASPAAINATNSATNEPSSAKTAPRRTAADASFS